jgi:hypothetical protein
MVLNDRHAGSVLPFWCELEVELQIDNWLRTSCERMKFSQFKLLINR